MKFKGKIIIFCFQTILTFNEIWNRFWCELASILAWFLRSWTILGRLGAVLGPSWGRPGPPCRLHKRLEFLNDFGVDFLIILGSFWEPSSVRLGPRWRHKSAKNWPGGSLGGSLDRPCTQIRLWKLLQRFFWDFWWFFIDVWTIVDWFLIEFWMSLVDCFQVFSLIFQGSPHDFSVDLSFDSCIFGSYYKYLCVMAYKQKQAYTVSRAITR